MSQLWGGGAREVGEQVRRTRDAEGELARAERALTQREDGHQAVRLEERERLDAGLALAGDLAAESSWAVAAARLETFLRSQIRDAGERLAEQRRVEACARRELNERRAAARVVERHRTAHDAEVRYRAELRREEDASEVWLSARRRGSRT